MKGPQADQKEAGRRGLIAFAPLLVSMLLILRLSDHSGPYHGRLRAVLCALALVGFATTAFALVRALRPQSKD